MKFLTTLLFLGHLLTGTPIGSSPSVDYANNAVATTTANLPAAAFDGNLNTFYASYERNYTWCGLDLGTPHQITHVAWSPRNDSHGPNRVVLGTFEGANSPDFLDAVPLYLITTPGTIGQYSQTDIQMPQPFRYVRYVGPNDARCNIAELQFYGLPADSMQPTSRWFPGNLPVVTIHTVGTQEPVDKINNLPAYVTIISTDGTQLADSATIRLRGNASMSFPKKPYRIKFQTKHNVLHSPAKAKKWCLINNYGDKTLMRNLVAMEYSRRLKMPYTPFFTPVDVFLNGEYKGCYQLADQLEIGKNKIDINAGYHLEMDGYAADEPETNRFFTTQGVGITIKEPDEEDIQPSQKGYIQGYYQQMENAVMNKQDWRHMLHEETFLKHFLIGELTGNTDTYWSMHMYKDAQNDTIFCGPEWDFDIAFDNDYRHYPTCQKTNWMYQVAGTNTQFVNAIIVQDATARSQYQILWSKARQLDGLNPDTIVALIDSLEQLLTPSATLNFMRWPILSEYVHMNPRCAGTYSGEVDYLRTYVRQRFQWVDNRIGLIPMSLPETTHPTTTGTQAQKYIKDGCLLIRLNGHTYTPTGLLLE